jgi:hypothetical protein
MVLESHQWDNSPAFLNHFIARIGHQVLDAVMVKWQV